MTARIKLTRGYICIVDDADFAALDRFSWYACHKTTKNFVKVYAYRNVSAREHLPFKLVSMHRQIMEFPTGKLVDHRDGDTLNNRRLNIRVCDKALNAANLRNSCGLSGLKGVSESKFNPGNPWRAYITIGGAQRYLGNFKTALEAAAAYDVAALKAWGEFAATNAMRLSECP